MASRRLPGIRSRRPGSLVLRLTVLVLAPVTAAGQFLVPVAVVAGGAAAVTAGSVAVAAAPAHASTGSVLILSTSVNGGASSAEAQAVPSGYTVTVATPATWDAMTTTQFQAYSAIVIGDPSSTSCSSTVPADALSTAATWGPAISGNVAVLGTAPALAGSAGTTLLSDAMSYAVAGGGTGLYVSLNCDYSAAAAATSVPLLADVDGGGFTVTGRSSSCPNSGKLNTWEANNAAGFGSLTNGKLGSWAAPACSVEETANSWPSAFTPVAYDAAATPADFTASDGLTGQPYVLLGTPPPTTATLKLTPAVGGEAPVGATAGGQGNPADPGASAGQSSAGDPVNTENGDFSQSGTDLSVPTFGPALDFTRTYDAQAAQHQTQTGTPGAMGYGWTDNWASSVSSASPVPHDMYTAAGGGTFSEPTLANPASVTLDGLGDVFISDYTNNRVEEIAATYHTQFGIAMTAGDMYTVAGSAAGTSGNTGDGGLATAALLHGPDDVAVDSAGNLYIDDQLNNRVQEVAAATGSQRGQSMTAGDIYTVAGSATGVLGNTGDGGAATSAFLDNPEDLAVDSAGDIYIADSWNNRVQEVFASGGQSWGNAGWTANDIYTVATSSQVNDPDSVSVDPAGNLYISDCGHNRVDELAVATGTQRGISMTQYGLYTIAGSSSGTAGNSGDGGPATSALLHDPTSVHADTAGDVYITDGDNNRIREVADANGTQWGQSMTAGDIYNVAGSSAGTSGYSGDGGPATSALLGAGPGGVTIDPSGNMYIADWTNHVIRQVTAATDAIGTLHLGSDAVPAVTAALGGPASVALDAAGDVFIADYNANRVDEIAATYHTQFGIAMTAGDVYTVAGSAIGTAGSSGDRGPADAALLRGPDEIAVDAAGNLYIADQLNNRVQEVAAATGSQRGQSMTAGDIYTVAGSASGASGNTGAGGAATSALLDNPEDLAVDSSGDIYIADSWNNRVQEVFASGGQSWGNAGWTANDIYTVVTSSQVNDPDSVSVDPAGNLYISDYGHNRIDEMAVATGTQRGISMTQYGLYTIAGSAAGTAGNSGDLGPAISALLHGPTAVHADAAGDVYISDGANSRIREVAAFNGIQWAQSMTAGDIYNVAGSPAGTSGFSGDGGPAASALLGAYSGGIAIDPAGNMYIADYSNGRLREMTATSATTIPAGPGQTSALSPAPGGLTVTQPGGAQVTFFAQQSGGGCAAPYVLAGQYCALPQFVSATLTSGAGGYTFSPAPGTTYTYASNGVFSGESDSAGNAVSITYGTPTPGSGNCPATAFACRTITSASGRALVLGVNTAGLVTSATDPMGRTWTYGYNSGDQLTSATDPMGHETSYTYGPGSTGNPLLASDLLTMTGPNAQPGGPDAGDATVNVYDSLGRVTSQTDPMGFQTSFNYCVNAQAGNCMNADTGTGFVTVTDPDQNSTVYDYQQGALAAQTALTGSTVTSEQDSTPDTTAGGTSGGTLLDTSTTDGDGNTTSYTYDSSGNITSSTSPSAAGGTAAATDSYTSTLQDASCSSVAEATVTCSQDPGPAPVTPGGVIAPPSSAPPLGLTYTLYDNDGNALYTTTGVYEPGASSAAYSRTSYQLFKGNSVTLGGTSTSCTNAPPSVSLPCATINADGVVTQLQYDSAGDQVQSSAPDGNSGGQVAATTDTYDADGEQLTRVAPDGNVTGANAGNYTTTTAWNADGKQTSVTQGNGTGYTDTPRTTSYVYDGDGSQTKVTDARGYATTTAYNADDRAVLVTDPDGNSTLTCYDGDGNATQTVPPAGVAAGLLGPSSCPAAYPAGYGVRLASDATTWTYDAARNQTSTTTPTPAGQTGHETTTTTYDGDGNPLTVTAPPASAAPGAPDEVTVNTYSAGEAATQTTGSGTSAASTVSYCYDPDGDKTAVVYADGNSSGTAPCGSSSPWAVTAKPQANYQTTYSYDSAGELVSTTTPATAAAPSGATTTTTYDPAGNTLTRTDPDHVTTTWTYTPLNLTATVSYSGSSAHSVSYSYDADGAKTAMTDATGSSSYTYNPFGELTSATNGNGQTTSYGYNPDGQVVTITYPLPAAAAWATSHAVSYGYDDADELTSVTDFNGNAISIGNTADGLPSSQALGSTGDTIATTYDSTGTPSSVALTNSASTLQSFTYSDAPSGNILSETDSPSSPQSPAGYTYDAQGRVTSMTPGSGSTLSYGFDPSGNLTALPTGATGSYDDAGELTAATKSGTTTSYAYNADGEQTSAAQGATNLASAAWNGAGQLTSYDATTADMSAASYDGDGMRASSTATPSGGSAVTQQYVWNTVAPFPQMIMDSQDAYIYSRGLAPAEQVSLATGAVTYLVTDALGSVRGTVSSSGTLTGTTSYDAWGNPATAGGLTGTTPFGYAGGYTDSSGLVYLINRYYQPSTGQFISVDPAIAQTLQPYAYAGDDPVSNTDPNGMCSWWSTRCWEFYALRGSLWIGGAAFAGLASWFCDDVTAGVCGIINNVFFRAAFAAASAIATCWLFRLCSTFWGYFWTGVIAFIGALVTGGLARVFRSPAKLYSFRLWIVYHFVSVMRYFKL